VIFKGQKILFRNPRYVSIPVIMNNNDIVQTTDNVANKTTVKNPQKITGSVKAGLPETEQPVENPYVDKEYKNKLEQLLT
jgi:hypothetical protein